MEELYIYLSGVQPQPLIQSQPPTILQTRVVFFTHKIKHISKFQTQSLATTAHIREVPFCKSLVKIHKLDL